MDLHSCIIVLRNQEVITSNSVEDSLGIIESQGDNGISTIQITPAMVTLFTPTIAPTLKTRSKTS